MPHPVGVPLRYPVGAGVPVLARVRADGSPRAVARGAGRGVPPVAADGPGGGRRRRPGGWAGGSGGGAGFEVFASITIAVELDRLSATASDRGPVIAVADRYDEPLTGHPRE